ncbi:MAG: hypothetical protein COB02_02275 [Candidatus Cloacimonadota bacterium]|nr:MAG: hypothetical protein COB02_02275 [Candidatus Cloacimonadota bacterium]
MLNKKVVFLFFSALFFWFSATIKHLGLIHFLCFIMARVLIMLERDKVEYKELLVYILNFICISYFYDFSLFYRYFEETSIHHSNFSTVLNLIYIAAIVLFFLFFIYLHIHSTNRKRIIFTIKHLLAMYVFICIVVLYNSYYYSSIMLNVSFLGGVLFIIYISQRFHLKSIRTTYIFTIYISIVASSILYFSHMGEAVAIFFFPLYLILFLIFMRKKTNLFNRVFLILCFIWSNFFDVSFLGINQESKLFTRGFNITHFNPWTWNRSYMNEMIDEIGSELEKYDFGYKEKVYIAPNLDIHISALLQVAKLPNKNIGNIVLLENYNSALDKYQKNLKVEGGFDEMIKSGVIAFLITHKNPRPQGVVRAVWLCQ